MKILLIFFLSTHICYAQIKDTIEAAAIVKRCLNFDESKIDSLRYYANQLEAFSKNKNYKSGVSDVFRLHGIAYEFAGDYDSAVYFYLVNLDYAKEQQLNKKVPGLYTDLISVYKVMHQYAKAKEYALQMLVVSASQNDTPRLSSAYTNLGLLYRNLHNYDSAIVCYNKALQLKTLLKDSLGMANLRINMSAFYYNQQQYQQAYQTILPNINYHLYHNEKGDLWYDYSNAASALIGLNNFTEAKHFIDLASKQIDTSIKSKQAEVLRIYTELYRKQGNYKSAYESLTQASDLEKEFINEDNNRSIAEAKEKYETEKKEKQNVLLSAQVIEEKLQKRNVTIIALSVGLLATLIAIGLRQKQKANKKLQVQNEIINRQVNKLAELNYEKNSLISIVSHDLGNPFGNIHVWSQVLQRTSANFNDKQKEAVSHIQNSTQYGQQLIRNILDVESSDTTDVRINLESFDLVELVASVINEMTATAEAKGQKLQLVASKNKLNILSDKQLVARICENLISNAIKYSYRDKSIFISIKDEDNNAMIEVKDEGAGIDKEEVPLLFSKYRRISSTPTGGEVSTGLGLSIVKRLVENLNGKIKVESVQGSGSTFTVVLSK